VANPRHLERLALVTGLVAAVLHAVSFEHLQRIKQSVHSGTLTTVQGAFVTLLAFCLLKGRTANNALLKPDTLVVVFFFCVLGWLAQELTTKAQQVDLGKQGFFVLETVRFSTALGLGFLCQGVKTAKQGGLVAALLLLLLLMYATAAAVNTRRKGEFSHRRQFKDE